MKNISDFIDNKVSYFYEIEFTRALSNEIMSLDEHIGNSVVDNIWDNNTWHIIQFEILDSLCLIKNDFKQNILNIIHNGRYYLKS